MSFATDYTQLCDKLEAEVDLLLTMLEREDGSAEHATLCVQQAKRVRRLSASVVQQLARDADSHAAQT